MHKSALMRLDGWKWTLNVYLTFCFKTNKIKFSQDWAEYRMEFTLVESVDPVFSGALQIDS